MTRWFRFPGEMKRVHHSGIWIYFCEKINNIKIYKKKKNIIIKLHVEMYPIPKVPKLKKRCHVSVNVKMFEFI